VNTFSILFVCTGNMCRSPMAERMTRAALARSLGPDAGGFSVYSAGTGTRDGRSMTPESAKVLLAYGANPDGFVSAELTPAHIGAADLVLTATRSHRSEVVTLEPTALRRSFTLTEFARTSAALTAGTAHGSQPGAGTVELPSDPVERSRALVAAAARRRGTIRPARPDEDDIPDPIGRPMEVYEAAGAQIAEAVGATVTALVGR
jgi:low molecular weight protein-tyrosine phosphatase